MSQAVSRPTTIRTFARETTPRRKGPQPREHALLAHRRNTIVKLVEPPSCRSASTIVFIGRNSRGHWVAQGQNGLYRGPFVERTEALKNSLFQNCHNPEPIAAQSREISLDIDCNLPP